MRCSKRHGVANGLVHMSYYTESHGLHHGLADGTYLTHEIFYHTPTMTGYARGHIRPCTNHHKQVYYDSPLPRAWPSMTARMSDHDRLYDRL